MNKTWYLLGLLPTLSHAANTLTLNVRNSFIAASNPLTDEEGSPLTSSDLFQLGYFDSAAPTLGGSTDFSNFVPFLDPSGEITDALGLTDSGTFSGEVTLDDMINVPSGTPSTLQYGLRFFNASTEADATFFNIVTNEDWTFTFQNVTPAPLPSTIDLSGFNNASDADIDGAVWLGTPFQATQATIPEPSSSISLLLGAALLLGSRRRK